jgi:hypothetical protein
MFTEQTWEDEAASNTVKHCNVVNKCPIDMMLQLRLIIIFVLYIK